MSEKQRRGETSRFKRQRLAHLWKLNEMFFEYQVKNKLRVNVFPLFESEYKFMNPFAISPHTQTFSASTRRQLK